MKRILLTNIVLLAIVALFNSNALAQDDPKLLKLEEKVKAAQDKYDKTDLKVVSGLS